MVLLAEGACLETYLGEIFLLEPSLEEGVLNEGLEVSVLGKVLGGGKGDSGLGSAGALSNSAGFGRACSSGGSSNS